MYQRPNQMKFDLIVMGEVKAIHDTREHTFVLINSIDHYTELLEHIEV
jgi:hypothetical protein